ncbi:MAG: RluA family pseudouridine synthase [Saprospiraceae bacterium]|nr:RluA family pseudouridine synthase [Lewinella sp.]
MDIQVLYEDNHLIAVNKPAGWLVQGDATGDTTLADWVKVYIKNRYQKPGDVFLGVIHRIDRPVSGAVIFARTSKALERMNRLFHDREVQKTYLAVTTERPNPLTGHLTHYLVKDRERNVAKAYDQMSNRAKGAKKSELEYELVGELGGHHLLKVNPITGRPHQIRVQLAKMGWPIRGDVKYGFKQPNTDLSIHLHCYQLRFEHPVKKEPVLITAELPRDQVWDMFDGAINAD